MFAFKVFSLLPRRFVPWSFLLLLHVPQKQQSAILSDQFRSLLPESPSGVSFLHNSAPQLSIFQRYGVSSSATSEPTDKEQVSTVQNTGASRIAEATNTRGDAKHSNQAEDSGSTHSRAADQTKESDSEKEEELSIDDLFKLVAEKEEILKLKDKEIETMQDEVLRIYADMENFMDRTRRKAENSKKLLIQSFAKSLLDVADNLERASLEVTKSFAKLDTSTDSAGALPLLKTLLEGVETTKKQLLEMVPSLQSGYLLYDRVIRPAKVGVTQAVENAADASTADRGSQY